MKDLAAGTTMSDPNAAPEKFLALLSGDTAVWYRARLGSVPARLYRVRTKLLDELADTLPQKKLRNLVAYLDALRAFEEHGDETTPEIPAGDESLVLLIAPDPEMLFVRKLAGETF